MWNWTGSRHGFPDQRKHDQEREKFLASRGIKTLRFWNSQLRRNAPSVRAAIFNELQARAPHPLPEYTKPLKKKRKVRWTTVLTPVLSSEEMRQLFQRLCKSPRLDLPRRYSNHQNTTTEILSWGRVVLMGIAQRSVTVKYEQKLRSCKRPNALVANAKTLGDWINAKREAKNLTPSHLAAKMGIAAAIVYSWEDNTHQPYSRQLVDLSTLLGFNSEELKMFHWQSMDRKRHAECLLDRTTTEVS